MKQLVINGQTFKYTGKPLSVFARDTSNSSGITTSGRTNFLVNGKKTKTSIDLVSLNECFYWLKQWSREKEYIDGYILDFEKKTVYFDSNEIKEHLLSVKFPAHKLENYFETFTQIVSSEVALTPPEPSETKSQELKKILLDHIEKGETAPIKMIETISGNRKVTRVYFDFIPQVFEPEYQFTFEQVPIPAIEGVAHFDSFRIDLVAETREEDENPSQSTIFINNIVDFVL